MGIPLLVAALVIAACGGDDGPGGGSRTSNDADVASDSSPDPGGEDTGARDEGDDEEEAGPDVMEDSARDLAVADQDDTGGPEDAVRELDSADATGPPPANHLLLSEVKVAPSTTEFSEIFNPTDSTVDLSNYFLWNATNRQTAGACCDSPGAPSTFHWKL